ncbi:putative 1-pyrroline-5-carboxylate dehydrogenase [Cooperia oncophora]
MILAISEPSDHRTSIAKYSYATAGQIHEAIEVALEARIPWERKPLKGCLSENEPIFLLHAADLAAGKYRMKLNAATMLGQGKNIVQAEIDSACELIDFFRFNSKFALDLDKYEPISTKISTNKLVYRGLEGFVLAVAPFNFTAIGGNLASSPVLMVNTMIFKDLGHYIDVEYLTQGNVVLWKPSRTAVLSNYVVYEVLEEAGVPPGVLSYLPSRGADFGQIIFSNAVNFTGSVPTFQEIWRKVAENLDKYITFPRLVGGNVAERISISCILQQTQMWHGSFRLGIRWSKMLSMFTAIRPKSRWQEIFKKISEIHKQIKIGDVRDPSIFFSAVIDKGSYDNIKSYIDYAKSGADGAEILLGGHCDDSKGYFIDATLIKTTNVKSRLISEEIFGPILTVYVYDDGDLEPLLSSIKDHTPFGLTGAVFAEDKNFLDHARTVLRDAVGNMYFNDKSTGAVVGQQPFGGARMSGTNDKAGGPHYGLRWTSPLTIKETNVPLTQWRYPSMD